MGITIIPANFESQSALIVETLRRCLTDRSDNRRFDWLYINCPHGRARAWLAMDDECAAVIGIAAAFPRRVYVGEKDSTAWVFGDFCLDSRYRSLGPALRLQRACMSVLESEGIAFAYDFPSVSMLAVYRRLTIEPAMKLIRLALPLRVDRKVRGLIPNAGIQTVVSALGNTALKMARGGSITDRSLDLSFQEGLCGAEYSALAEELRNQSTVWVQHSAEYLNWRFLNNPLDQYRILTARRAGKLVGYAVFTMSVEDATLVDIVGAADPALVKSLIRWLISFLEKQGVVALSAPVVESHPWLPWFYELGFRARETASMIVVPAPGDLSKRRLEGVRWSFMQGDRDS